MEQYTTPHQKNTLELFMGTTVPETITQFRSGNKKGSKKNVTELYIIFSFSVLAKLLYHSKSTICAVNSHIKNSNAQSCCFWYFHLWRRKFILRCLIWLVWTNWLRAEVSSRAEGHLRLNVLLKLDSQKLEKSVLMKQLY